jgi:predicted  nucleic acid-binding Zn-ribbon protein
MIIQSISKKDSTEINQLHNEIFRLEEEKKVLEHQLRDYNIKIEQIKEYAAKFENDNNVLKLKIADLKKKFLHMLFIMIKLIKFVMVMNFSSI